MNDAADRRRGRGRDGRHGPEADDPPPGQVHPIDEALATIDATSRLRRLHREGLAPKVIAKQLNREWVPGPDGVLWTATLVRRAIDEASHGPWPESHRPAPSTPTWQRRPERHRGAPTVVARSAVEAATPIEDRSVPPAMPASVSLPSWPPPSGLRRPSFVPSVDPRRSQAVAQASAAVRASASIGPAPPAALPASPPAARRTPSAPGARSGAVGARRPQWLAATGAAVVLVVLAGLVSVRFGAPVGAGRSPEPGAAATGETAAQTAIQTNSPTDDGGWSDGGWGDAGADDPSTADTVAAGGLDGRSSAADGGREVPASSARTALVASNPVEMDEGRLVLVSDGGDRWGMIVAGGVLRVVAPGEDYWDCVFGWARPVDSVSLDQLEAAQVAIDWVDTVDRCPDRVLTPTDDPTPDLSHYEGSIISLPETPWGQASYWVRNGELHEIPHAPDYWDCLIRAEGRVTVVTEAAVARLGWSVAVGRADQCPDAAW